MPRVRGELTGREPGQGHGECAVRDALARERTHLANERTLLAYVRTALGFLVIGGPLVLVLDAPVGPGLGWTMIGAGGVVLGFGLYRFVRLRRRIEANEAWSQDEEAEP